MKFCKLILAIAVCLTVVFSACKKADVYTDRQSSGSLIDSSGECLPKTLEGTYNAGITLVVENYIDVHVMVDSVGAFDIKTDSLNGYYFQGIGVFGFKGDNRVRLYGHGRPVSGQTDIFTVTYGTTSCSIAVKVSGAPPSTFSLGGGPSACTGFVLGAGTYIAGTALTSANTVTLDVNVSTVGAYSIKTNTENGIYFSKADIFTTTGPQTVTLTGTGTPTAAATSSFTVTGKSNTCTFNVTVDPGSGVPPVPVPSGDYYPLTQNSYWTYDEAYLGSSGDTLKLAINGNETFLGNSYAKMITTFYDGSKDTTHSRKSGTEYHAWSPTDQFTSAISFDTETFADIIFLKEGPTGTTWTSATYSGTESGIAENVKYVFNVADANTSITVNGVTFNNVMKVVQETQVSISVSPFTTVETVENYYAKGVGLVKSIMTSTGSSTPSDVLSIRHYQVN